MKRYFYLLVAGLLLQNLSMGQTVMPLYKTVPNSKQDATYSEKAVMGKDGVTRISKVTNPTITVFRPVKNMDQHTAVIICPGGGYEYLSFSKEGTEIAQTLIKWGITAIVLKYRLPSDAIMKDKSIGPLQDAQRAIQLIRINAKQWNIDPSKIGIMGFSAGGSLAATASTHFDRAVIANVDNISLRPDFSVLAYPVVSMQKDITHMGSRNALLGKNPGPALVNDFSNELQVGAKTPPAFLVQASDDRAVSPENSIKYYEALLKNNVPAELHLYQNGGHGFGQKLPEDQWMNRLKSWMEHNHYLK
ncbi:alpha/beta hydrolase [Arachidicoccus sp.]|uniref:alpha/beta hydrolase n=1 Tax=Arachidicoccus sp. TaxID=1872624 RepID=UPI003D1A2A64